MPLEDWLRIVVPAFITILGGFAAAMWGARVGFARTRRERAFDRRVSWYEEVIEASAVYEEPLAHLRRDYLNKLVVRREKESPNSSGVTHKERDGEVHLPKRFRPEPGFWTRVVEAEADLRRALRLHDLHTTGDAGDECAHVLNTVATLAVGQWFDLGPAPELSWTDIPSRQSRLSQMRRALESELREILRYSSWLQRTFPKWAQRREVRRLVQEQY